MCRLITIFRLTTCFLLKIIFIIKYTRFLCVQLIKKEHRANERTSSYNCISNDMVGGGACCLVLFVHHTMSELLVKKTEIHAIHTHTHTARQHFAVVACFINVAIINGLKRTVQPLIFAHAPQFSASILCNAIPINCDVEQINRR